MSTEQTAEQFLGPTAEEFLDREPSAEEFLGEEPGVVAKVIGTPAKNAFLYNQGIEEGVASMARGAKRLSDVGPRKNTFAEHERTMQRAGEDWSTEAQAAAALDAEREQARQALMMPAASLEEAATQSAKEFANMAKSQPGYRLPGVESAGAMTPVVASAMVPVVGGPAAVVEGGLQTAGDVWWQAYDFYRQRLPEDQAVAVADRLAGKAGAANALVFSALPGPANRAAAWVLGDRLAERPVAQAAARTALAGGQAGALMAADTAMRDAQAAGTYRPELGVSDVFKEMAEAAATGAVVGAGLHGPMEAAKLPPKPTELEKSYKAARENQPTAEEFLKGAEQEATAETANSEEQAASPGETTVSETAPTTPDNPVGEKTPAAATAPELSAAEQKHVDNVRAVVDDELGGADHGVQVVYEPGKRNAAGRRIEAWYENGQMVVNAAEISSDEQLRRAVREEFGHRKLATPEGQAALAEFINQSGLSGNQVLELAARGYMPEPGESREDYERRLHDEFIAKHARQPLGWFADLADRLSGWVKGKLGVELTQAQAARAILRQLDPTVNVAEEAGNRLSARPELDVKRKRGTPIMVTGPDGTVYPASFDGLQDFSLIGKGMVPQISFGEEAPPGFSSHTTTYGPVLDAKGYKFDLGRRESLAPLEGEARSKRLDEEQRRRGIFVSVSPVVRDELGDLAAAEVKKRVTALKMTHLARVGSDIAEAFGVPIESRGPVVSIEGAGRGERDLNVSERIELGTDDMELAKTMAGLMAASAPQFANRAVVWRDDPAGSNYTVSIRPRNRVAAMRMVEDWQRRHPRDDFTFDPASGTLSTVLGGADETELAESIIELKRFVERHRNEGNIQQSEGPVFRKGSVHFPEPSSYGSAIAQARLYAGTRPGPEGQRILDVAARAEDRLRNYQAGLLTSAKARRELARLPVPGESAQGILKSLRNQTFESIRGFARWMDTRFQRRYGVSMSPIGDPKALKRASRALVYDILDGLREDGSGKGWYDDRVRATFDEIAKLHPELEEDPNGQGMFAAILAATSQGYTVGQNFEIAEAVYRRWKREGRLPEDMQFAKANKPINENLRKIQGLIDTRGMDWFMHFMDQEVTGGYLRDELGMQPSGVTLKQTVRGARVLGPKIGSFFGNLRGRFDTITMDLWYTRSMHRYLGETRISIKSQKAQNALAWFSRELRKQARLKDGRTYGLNVRKDLRDADATVEAAARVFNSWAKDGYPKMGGQNELERAARAVKQHVGDMRGAPQNKSHREYFAAILRDAQQQLKQMGFDMSPADMQAVLWYREKNLFAKAGVASDAAKPADYLDAAMALRDKIVRGEGVWANKTAEAPRLSLADEPALRDAPRFSLVDDLAENFKRARLSFQSVFSPQNMDPGAKRFANSLRDLNGQQAIALVRSAAKMQELRDFFDRTPVPKDWAYDPAAPLPINYQVMAALETNRAALPRHLQDFAQVFDQEFAHRIAEVQRLRPGALQQLIQDYFPHMWQRPTSTAVGNFMAEVAARQPLEGSKAFMKQRTLPTILEGLQRGLKPISDNPVDMLLAKMHQMDKFILAAKLLREAKDTGMLRFYRLGQRVPPGMRIVDDRAGTVFAPPAVPGGIGPQLVGHWALPDGAANVLSNFLSPSLQRFWLYRNVRALSNILNGAQLGFSAFHVGFTSMDASVSSLATGLTYLLRGRVAPAAKSMLATPFAPVLNYYLGKAVQARMVEPAARGVKAFGLQVPFSASVDSLVGQIANLAVKGGLRAEQDPFWQTAITRNLKRALYEGGVRNYAKAGMSAPFALMEQMIRPIAEFLVPRQKLGVFAQLALQEMDRIGWGATNDEVRAAMARAADTTEDRMGQMTYDNLFYNRAVKDLALLAFRAYGWQLGKYRAMYGAGVDTVRAVGDLARGQAPQITNRMLYPVALTLVAGGLGALVHRMMTGKNPETLSDYFFPKNGQVNPDGTPSRLMLPTYLKDLVSDWHDFPDAGAMAKSAYHKLNPAVAGVVDMWLNQDYYGTRIVDPNDPAMKRLEDLSLYAAKLFTPFSVAGTIKLHEQNAPVSQLVLPFIGVVPAKKSLFMTPAQLLSAEITQDSLPRGGRSRDAFEHSQLLKSIVQDIKDRGMGSEKLAAALQAGQLRPGDEHAVASMLTVSPLQYQVSRMEPPDGMRVWRLASAEERAAIAGVLLRRVVSSKTLTEEKRSAYLKELVKDGAVAPQN